MPVKASLRVKTPQVVSTGAPADTSHKPVDENAADRLAHELGVGQSASPGGEPIQAEVVGEGEGAATTRTASTTALAHRPAQPVSTRSANLGNAFEGDWDERDVRLPQLKIVAGSGPLSQKYQVGTLLYADEELFEPPNPKLGEKNPTLQIVPVKIQKQWRENLTDDEVKEGLMPRVFSSIEEAIEAHGPLCNQWPGDGSKPRVSPSARCLLLLQEPEGCKHPGFMRTLDGKNYAPAIFYAGNTAYGEFATRIFNKMLVIGASIKDTNPLSAFFWTFRVTQVKRGAYNVVCPATVLTKGVTGPEVRAYADELRGVKVKDDGAAE